jgi:hypothetical protein
MEKPILLFMVFGVCVFLHTALTDHTRRKIANRQFGDEKDSYERKEKVLKKYDERVTTQQDPNRILINVVIFAVWVLKWAVLFKLSFWFYTQLSRPLFKAALPINLIVLYLLEYFVKKRLHNRPRLMHLSIGTMAIRVPNFDLTLLTLYGCVFSLHVMFALTFGWRLYLGVDYTS